MEIMRELSLGRGAVQTARRRLGLITTPYRGPRKPVAPEIEREFLALVNGMSVRAASHRLRLKEHVGRAIAERHGIRSGLDPTTRARLRRAIRNRSDYAINLAQRFHVGYKYVLRLAREIHGVAKFRHGYPAPPFSSNFPTKRRTQA